MGEFLEQQAVAGPPLSTTMVTRVAPPQYVTPSFHGPDSAAPGQVIQVAQPNRPLVAAAAHVQPSVPFRPVIPGSGVGSGIATMSPSTTTPGGRPVATSPVPGATATQTPAQRLAALPKAQLVELVQLQPGSQAMVEHRGAAYMVADGVTASKVLKLRLVQNQVAWTAHDA